MAHLSLYRAFRPATFDEIVRQEHVVRILKNQISQDAVGHAYLFCGPRGTGKTSVARIFARAVNCKNPKNGSPCGVCETCKALDGGSLDVTEIDAASNNGVNEMRDLREKVQYPPVTGAYKVYIIDEVHMLTDSAFNALLKTLEEPPRHAIFILATTEPQKIPATILSRCMRLDFKLIPQTDLEGHLKGILKEIGKRYEDSAVSAIARAGAGSDRDMLSIAEMCLAYSDTLTYEGVTAVLGGADFMQMSELCERILTGRQSEALSCVEKILSEGKSVGVLMRDTLQFLNHISIAKTCRNAEELLCLPKEMFERVSAIAQTVDPRAILRASDVFTKTEMDLRFVSSPRICFETAVVKASMPAADYDIEALMQRISALEKRLENAGGMIPSAQTVPTVDLEVLPKKTQTVEENYDFPTEEPIFDEPYLPVPTKVEEPIAPPPVVQQTTVPSTVSSDAQETFGRFMRTLRKTHRNGVLFTMCADLEAAFESGALVLTTESETVYRALNREDNQAIMRDVFASIGVLDYRVCIKGRKVQNDRSAIEALKRDFSDYPIELK